MSLVLKILSPQWMLLLGLFGAFFIQDREQWQNKAKTLSKNLLQFCVILLGANLNFNQVLKQGAQGFTITALSLTAIFSMGFFLIKFLKIPHKQGILIIMGTAICGGSAIAALAPVILASSTSVAMAMGIVFLLNSLAVFIFPPLGHALSMGQSDFGLFSALAIHDTSSVVAAASLYGSKALDIATTIKLTRALWIIPITLFFSYLEKKKNHKNKKISVKIPLFIFMFLGLSLLFTLFDQLSSLRPTIKIISKVGLGITLGLIGLSLNFEDLRKFGPKNLLFAVILWLFAIANSWLLMEYS